MVAGVGYALRGGWKGFVGRKENEIVSVCIFLDIVLLASARRLWDASRAWRISLVAKVAKWGKSSEN